MKLATKIQKSMFLVIVVALSLAYSSFVFIVYNQSIHIAKNQIVEQAIYVKNLLNNTENLLNTIDTALLIRVLLLLIVQERFYTIPIKALILKIIYNVLKFKKLYKKE